jgi:hypothetical protein
MYQSRRYADPYSSCSLENVFHFLPDWPWGLKCTLGTREHWLMTTQRWSDCEHAALIMLRLRILYSCHTAERINEIAFGNLPRGSFTSSDQADFIRSKARGAVIPPGTGFPFCRLLRLARLRWRYSNPPPHGLLNSSVLKSKSHYDRRAVGQFVLVSRPFWSRWPDATFIWVRITFLIFHVGRLLWREDASVICRF